MDSLMKPPLGFAHRGARAHAKENTLDSFRLALRLGASALESDVWITADGVAVLDHDGVVRVGARRRRIGDLARRSLPGHIPTLGELYDACGAGFDLSLDVKDPQALSAVLDEARQAGALELLWLCHPDWELLATWREIADGSRLVDSTRLRKMKMGPERRAADLAAAGIDAVNMHWTDWTLGLTTLFHRFNRLAFGWDAQQPHALAAILAMGIDGVYSDHVDRLVEAIAHQTT